MLYPIKLVDVELSQPLTTLEGLAGYKRVQALVRLHGVPLGTVNVPITNDRCLADTLGQAILKEHGKTLIHTLLTNRLAQAPLEGDLTVTALLAVPSVLDTFWQRQGHYPLVTVAVCTRDRPEDIKRCLAALGTLDYPNLEILIVDNAPTHDGVRNLIEGNYPQVRYVCEPRPGLDWARNRAILEARGEIIAYTDDDVVVDPIWVKALVQVFLENPDVMAVTGLVVPYELETEPQVLFEHYGGFGQGFEPKRVRITASTASQLVARYGTPGQFGTGANMAYRRSLFDQVGYFDPALDVGTVTNGAGDLEMFFRVLKAGYGLVYEPAALVRHRHRRDEEKLRVQLANNGVGLYAYFVRNWLAYPEHRLAFIKLGIWWLGWWLLRRWWINIRFPHRFPTALIVAEFRGCFVGLGRYQQALKTARTLAQSFPDEPKPEPLFFPTLPTPAYRKQPRPADDPTAVRTVELNQPLQPLLNLTDYTNVQVLVTWQGDPLGQVVIANQGQPVGVSQLARAIVQTLGVHLLDLDSSLNPEFKWARATAELIHLWQLDNPQAMPYEPLPTHIPVSIALATFDRPDDLHNCLTHLFAQPFVRPVEVIVVDNHPSSGLTPPVVAQFPAAILVSEERQGLAYARNAGIVASKGEIILATDDDVTIFPDWLERVVAPFSRPDVMIVTGNVLPIELENGYQQAFEAYGGLGRGFERFEVAGDWYESFPRQAVPTWRLGATAGAAFRASIFSDPAIGLMEEVLGPGMPSGTGEDAYLFYKVVKADYTLLYEPDACVWHKHRNTEKALRRQLYNYSKGGPSYHLVTWFQDGDWRGLWRIMVELPYQFFWRFQAGFRGITGYPMSLLVLELWGVLGGPWALWQSYQRVKRMGRSGPYIPPHQRIQPSSESSNRDQSMPMPNSEKATSLMES